MALEKLIMLSGAATYSEWLWNYNPLGNEIPSRYLGANKTLISY